jgi:hypothetical protein
MGEISDSELAALADLYDRFAHALDPFSQERDLAERQFYSMLSQLHYKHAPEMDERTFNRGAVSRCKKYLLRN